MKKQIRAAVICIGVLCSVQQLVAQKLPKLIPFRKGNLWGYCDSNKKVIIAPKYTRVAIFPDDQKAVVVETASMRLDIDRRGKQLASVPKGDFGITELEDPNSISQVGTSESEISSLDVSTKISGNGDPNGPTWLKQSCEIKGVKYNIYVSPENGPYLECDGRIIYAGCLAIRPIDTVFVIQRTDKQFYLGNRFGKLITNKSYDAIESTDADLPYIIFKKGNYYGLLTITGKEVLPATKYSTMESTERNGKSCGLFEVTIDAKTGFIDFRGTEYWAD